MTEREDMLARFETYLKGIYPDWDKEKLTYSKYDFWSCLKRNIYHKYSRAVGSWAARKEERWNLKNL